MKKIILIMVCAIFFASCDKDYLVINDEEIQDYLSDNSIVATKTESGLYYKINTEGDGNYPTAADEVTVNYAGKLINGTQFEANDNLSFPLNGVISGWTEGLQLVDRGGSISLYIPSHLGYGTQGSGSVPPNAVMIFEIDLLDF